MSNLGFFHWLRDSVRRSVLLGFSDAVEQIGTPSETGEISPKLLAMLRETSPAIEHQPASERTPTRQERKRLGRSLEQLREGTAKPAP